MTLKLLRIAAILAGLVALGLAAGADVVIIP